MAAETGHFPNRAYIDQNGDFHMNDAKFFGDDDTTNLKFARGQLTTVTAADTVVTGLNTVVAAVACLDSDPADDPEWVSCTIGDQAGSPAAGSIIVKTWKNTAGTDPTPAAATTFSKKVNWIAIGT